MIRENALLSDVTALSNLATVGADLLITDNPSLAAADAEAAAAIPTVRGDTTVEDNGP